MVQVKCHCIISMVWRVISDFDADPFNLNRKDVRGLVSIRISNYCLYHGKSYILKLF